MKQPTIKALARWILDTADYRDRGDVGYAGGLTMGMYASRAISKPNLDLLIHFAHLAHYRTTTTDK